MTRAKTERAQGEIQEQMTDPTITQQVIDRPIQQDEEQGHQESGYGHLWTGTGASSRTPSLGLQMLLKEIGNRVVAFHAVIVFEHVVAFVFEDEQVNVLALGF